MGDPWDGARLGAAGEAVGDSLGVADPVGVGDAVGVAEWLGVRDGLADGDRTGLGTDRTGVGTELEGSGRCCSPADVGTGRTRMYSASTARNRPEMTSVEVRGRPVTRHPRWPGRYRGRPRR